MTDRYKIFELLGVEPRGLFLTDLNVNWSGHYVTIDGLYDPDELIPFRLTFAEVRSVVCTMPDEVGMVTENEPADVYFLLVGEGQYRAKAVIHTDQFEVEISYGALEVMKEG